MLMTLCGVLLASCLGQCGGLTNSMQSVLVADEGNVSVSAGHTVNFTCTLINTKPKNNIVWRRGYEVLATRNILISADPRVSLSYTEHKSTLTIGNTTAQDSNEYVCQVSLIDELVSASFFLDVLVPPTIHTEMLDTRITVAEGATSRLVCNASGNPKPKITWSKEGTSLGPLASQPDDGSLVLGGVTSQDSGVYTCLAENGIPPGATLDFHVFVQYVPVVGVEEDSITSGINQKAVLTCIVDGQPLPQVTWQFEDESALPMHPGFRFHSAGRLHTLTIDKLKAAQMGNYSCVAQNSLGTKKVHIEVHGRPGSVSVRSDMSLSTRRKHTLIWSLVSYSRILEYRLLYRLLPQESSEKSLSTDWTNVIIPGQQHTSSNIKKMEWTLEKLLPDTRYECIVQARNDFGWSTASSRHTFSTFNPSKTGSSVQLLEKSSWTSSNTSHATTYVATPTTSLALALALALAFTVQSFATII